MQTVCFRYFGRVAHFMRAEMNASALSYPVPPRTTLLGLLGAIMGIPKDIAQEELSDAMIGLRIRNGIPLRHYHKANIRKRNGIMNPVSIRLKAARADRALDDPSGKGAASQVTQEWLINPDFEVFVASADSRPWLPILIQRLQVETVKSHFTPCMGPAWMIAQLELLHVENYSAREDGEHMVETLCRTDEAESPLLKRLMETKGGDGSSLAVQEVRMPRDVSTTRVFSHARYYMEMNGNAIPLRTHHAWSDGTRTITFL